MRKQELLFDPHVDPHTRSLPLTHQPLLPPPLPPCCPLNSIPPTDPQPRHSQAPAYFPSMTIFRALYSSRHLTKGLSSYYLPLDWRAPVPSSPMYKHLSINAVTHLTIPLSKGLSRFPLVLNIPPTARKNIPPPLLMALTHKALKAHFQLGMLTEWESLHPSPDYYIYPCRLDPHPFLGLDKFIAGRLHQMRAHKSYLAAHPSWWSEDPDTTCPRCSPNKESFEHAILHCSARSDHRCRYLEPALSLRADSPLWDNNDHLHALSDYLSATRTGFPPQMAPSHVTSRTSCPISPPPPF